MTSLATDTEPPRVESDLEACSHTKEKDEEKTPAFHCEDITDVPDFVFVVDQEAEQRSVLTSVAWYLSPTSTA